jgi:hypothetical protein
MQHAKKKIFNEIKVKYVFFGLLALGCVSLSDIPKMPTSPLLLRA